MAGTETGTFVTMSECRYLSPAGFSVQPCSFPNSSNSGALKPSGSIGQSNALRGSFEKYFSNSRLARRTAISAAASSSPAKVAAKSPIESFSAPIQTAAGSRLFAPMYDTASVLARSKAARGMLAAPKVPAMRVAGPSTTSGGIPSRRNSISAAESVPASVKLQQFTRSHKPHARHVLRVRHIVVKNAIAPLRLSFGPSPRTPPCCAFGVGPLGKIHRVPKLSRHKFGRVIVNADDATAMRSKLSGRALETFVALRGRLVAIERRAQLESSHVVDMQQSAIPKRLIVQPHLRPFIQINGNPHVPQSGIRLWRPGIAGLSIATRPHSEDAREIARSRTLAAIELRGALHVAEIRQVERGRGLHAMEVRVIANVM